MPLQIHVTSDDPDKPDQLIAFAEPDPPTGYLYTDVDGDRIGVWPAVIPGVGRGVNIRTDRAGCSIPRGEVEAFIEAVRAAAAGADETHRAWLFWGEDGTLLDDAEYDEGPVTRERAAAEYAADRDMPAATIQPVPYEALPAIRALCQQARQDGRQVTRDDIAKLTTQEA